MLWLSSFLCFRQAALSLPMQRHLTVLWLSSFLCFSLRGLNALGSRKGLI